MENVEKTADKPFLVIEPGRRKITAIIREAWVYRELFLFLAWRDISVRYKQTIFGVAWVVFQPVLSMVIYTIIFHRLADMQSPGDFPYQLFVLVGIVVWGFFGPSVVRAGESFVLYESLVRKIYFPRMAIPVSACLAFLLDFLISFSVLAAMMIYYRFAPGIEILALPLLIALLLFLSVILSLLFGSVNARYRDIKFIQTFVFQIWLFATPVFYPLEKIPEQYRSLAYINPLTGIVEGFRWCILGIPFPAFGLAASFVITLIIAVITILYFQRVERTLADVI